MSSPADQRHGGHSRAPTRAVRIEASASPRDVPLRNQSSASLASYSVSPGDLTRSRTLESSGERSSLTSSERDNGLRRIRQPTSTSRRTSETNPQATRLAPFTLNISHVQSSSRRNSITNPSGPPSPVLLSSGEDLSRFPQESLHSFSFTHQADSMLYDRQNVLRRSVDFIRDRNGLAASNTGILDAQARVTGNADLQNMVNLLKRAEIGGFTAGPLTGPALPSMDNVFEKSFVSESPTEATFAENRVLNGDAGSGSELSVSPTTTRAPGPPLPLDTQVPKPVEDPSPMLGRRSQLKRTFTDIAGYSLQDRLSNALATPYQMSTETATHPASLVSPQSATSEPKRGMTLPPGSAPHSHGTRQNAASQAIFTTDSNSPWIIASANDLACLVFGVTKAEVRKMGIMEVIRPERRKWLENKLRPQDASPVVPQRSSSRQESPAGHSRSSTPSASMGNGVTAKLLSKPPARQTYQSRRSRTAEPSASEQSSAKLQREPSIKDKDRSRGVLLCGDVVPIQKRNGAFGSATLWVKEKNGSLIWVLEEIAEDVALLSLDEIGSITKGEGAIEAIFGIERVRRGMDVKKLLPQLPKKQGTNTGALDWTLIQDTRRYTAHTASETNIPVTVELLPDQPTIRVSSFPHVAGIMVISAQKLQIVSSNSVFSAALFGLDNPDGKTITDLIPRFDKYLGLISDEDSIELRDGIVIPEHSFRRARALLAMREGREDATTLFLYPTGLPALHRDGSEIMIDVQMRVVKPEPPKPSITSATIDEEDEVAVITTSDAPSNVSYALWITYSKQLHAVKHSIGINTPMLLSRPGTPPRQPSPGQTSPPQNETSDAGYESSMPQSPDPNALAQQLHEASTSPLTTTVSTSAEPYEHPSPAAIAAGVKIVKKKLISDFVILQEMGKGAYGEVKLVRWKKTQPGNTMVVKYVTKRRILVDTWTRDRKLGTVPLEIHVLDYLRKDGLQHDHIVEMVDFFEDDINYYIEMLPHGMPGMDLFDWIEMKPNMSEDACRTIFKQIADGLYHLHIKARVVHRDIKDENIILDGEGNVKIADFGSAAYIKSGPFDVFVGTLDYAAPEVLRGLPYRGKEQDVWALGILLYTIIYKENPFYNVDEIMDHDLRVPYVMSEDCLDLIRKMLDRDVERRIGISDVVRHKWCATETEAEAKQKTAAAAAAAATTASPGTPHRDVARLAGNGVVVVGGESPSGSETSEFLPKVVPDQASPNGAA